MIGKIRFHMQRASLIIAACLFTLSVYPAAIAGAITPLPTPDPQPGSYGLEAIKKQPPPTVGATITTPGSGASFAKSPITVSGICPDDLLVEVYDNGVMVGSVMCKNGSFSVEVSLFAGVNELTANVYDWLDQTGPVSNTVTVNFTDTSFSAFGAQITLTSAYGRRSASPGTELQWPLQLSGGTGPYAFSFDWNDGPAAQLKSQPATGQVAAAHTYKKAGIYQVNVKVTDVNGVTAFLQVIAVANGKVDNTPTATNKSTGTTKVLWIPAAVSLVMLVPAFWLGRQSQIVSIRNKMLRERDAYKKK